MKKTTILLALFLALSPNPAIFGQNQKISVSTTSLAFGKVLRGNQKTLEFTIKTKASLSVKADRLWIMLDETALKSSGKVKVTIKASLLPLGTDHSGLITISAPNFEKATIKVSVSTEKNIELKMSIGSKTASLNGRTLNVKKPMRMKGCTPLIPLRFVADVIGAQTIYNPKDSTIKIFRLDRVIEILPDVEEYEVNGKTKISNPAPKMYDGTLFVPLGFVSSAFGICVDWDRTGQKGTIGFCD
jgi:hypothetical protein